MCSEESVECWFNRCEDCKDRKLFQIAYPFLQDVESWYQREKVQSEKGKGRLEKIHADGKIRTLHEKLIDVLLSFTAHQIIKQQQQKRYKELKELLPSPLGDGMLQVAFTENYTTQWLDEVQSAHWCKNQVTQRV